jgi:hypothetical protein
MRSGSAKLASHTTNARFQKKIQKKALTVTVSVLRLQQQKCNKCFTQLPCVHPEDTDLGNPSRGNKGEGPWLANPFVALYSGN